MLKMLLEIGIVKKIFAVVKKKKKDETTGANVSWTNLLEIKMG